MAEDKPEVLETVVLAGGGVEKRVLKRGADAGDCPPRHAKVTVHYTGRLDSGDVFDSSRTRGQPFEFRLGEGQVIKGWDVGVASMCVGERAELVCRADHAYGDLGSPPKIPGGATLTFDVELLEYNTKKPVTEDGGVMKEVLREGEGYNRPNVFATAVVRYTGRVGSKTGAVFDGAHAEEAATLVVDEDAARPRGLDEAMKNMLAGERARFTVRPSYGYGAQGNEAAGVPPNATLVYEMELVSFEKGRETWDMTHEEKVEHGDRVRSRGNASFKRREWDVARVWYKRAVDVFQYVPDEATPEQRAEVKRLKSVAHSNLAAVAMQTKAYDDAIRAATEAIEADKDCAKALARRGTAHMHLGDWDQAEQDLARAVEIGSTDATAKLLARVRKRKRDTAAKERKLYSNLFERVDLS